MNKFFAEQMAPEPWSRPAGALRRGPPASPGPVPEKKRRLFSWDNAYLPAVLFVLTLLTTLMAGAMQRGVSPADAIVSPGLLFRGLPFAGTLMLILGAHELGHYFAGRRWGVAATLPFFIPAPTLLGTFGALIRIRGIIPNRRALLDLAVAGPLAGMAVAVPAALIGLTLSRIVPQEAAMAGGGLGLGTSWLFEWVSWLALGTVGAGNDVVLHPVAFAGWCGFLVTSLNLIPAGQLDGGHIVYALFGRWHRPISLGVGCALAGMSYWWPGWLIWAALALFLGRRHPPLLDEGEGLGPGRRFLGFVCLVLLVFTFTRVPLLLF